MPSDQQADRLRLVAGRQKGLVQTERTAGKVDNWHGHRGLFSIRKFNKTALAGGRGESAIITRSLNISPISGALLP